MTLKETQAARNQIRSDFRDLKKHFVRVHGWLPVFERYGKLKKRRVQYLTLCAKEAIDVRYFALKGHLYRNAERNDYPSLTFIESDNEHFAAIAEALGKVRLGIHGRLEDALLLADDPHHRDLVDSFPYDIVNLDFCGDIVPRHEHPYSSTLQCIERIVELQAQKHQANWHLFLTFRAQVGLGHDEAHDALREIVEENLKDANLKLAYGPREAPGALLVNNYAEFLRIGVCKLIANRASAQGYQMTLEGTYAYSRQAGAYQIVKVIAGFTNIRKSIPKPHQELAAYQGSVRDLFQSSARLVEDELTASEALVQGELQVVVQEIDQAGIVS